VAHPEVCPQIREPHASRLGVAARCRSGEGWRMSWWGLLLLAWPLLATLLAVLVSRGVETADRYELGHAAP
jgi:hypothetical protein